jgi:hypothetical protein
VTLLDTPTVTSSFQNGIVYDRLFFCINAFECYNQVILVPYQNGTPAASFQPRAVFRGRYTMNPSVIVTILFVVWGVVTTVLFVLVLYRATLSSKEDDQIFIGAAEQVHAGEQRKLVAKMTRLRAPIIALTAISAVLFLSAVGVWIYQGFMNS